MKLEELYEIDGYAAAVTKNGKEYTAKMFQIPFIIGTGKSVFQAIDDAREKYNDDIYKNVIEVCRESYLEWDRQTIAEQYLETVAAMTYIEAEPCGHIKEYLDILLKLFIARS